MVGAGKSTTLNYLHGCKMIRVKGPGGRTVVLSQLPALLIGDAVQYA